jgi:predicted RND superfamily exporter protein
VARGSCLVTGVQIDRLVSGPLTEPSETDFLQSPLTRAVIWIAPTTATAFGSLWVSNHPGTSSMGKLLALTLVTTLCAAVLFQPALMGAPRNDNEA